jgi:tRNA(Ile2)-agmatinylcytidine synthase
MSLKTHPFTFNNFDEEKKRVMITPRGADPVLLGIRGEDPETLLKAYHLLKIREPIDGYMIFKSNQGTGAHLKPELNPTKLKAYRAGHMKCIVSKKPWTERGGHVYFEAENKGCTVTCAAYEPTGDFRKTVLNLIPGDKVEIGGSVRKKSRKHNAAINLEYIHVYELAKDITISNPLCRKCGKRMESKGKGQPFRCSNCGFEDPLAKKIRTDQPRIIQKNRYVPPPRAQRHLTKPLQRHNINNNRKTAKLIDGWFKPEAITLPSNLAKT